MGAWECERPGMSRRSLRLRGPFRYDSLRFFRLEHVQLLVEISSSGSQTLNSNGLPLIAVLSHLNVGDHVFDTFMAFKPSETFLPVQQHAGQPALRHLRGAVAFDIFLAGTHAREDAFNGVGGVQRFTQQRSK